MSLYYFPFWLEPWWRDFKVQSLPRDTRLTFYDLLCLLWERDMRLDNDDEAISYYLRIPLDSWAESKRLLLKADLIQLVQANKRIDCDRLNMEYHRIIEGNTKQSKRAKNGWEKRKETQ